MYNELVSKDKTMAVIGLGYVGLPIALEFAKKIRVIGFDIREDRIEMMRKNIDPSNELTARDFEGCDITFTASIDDLKEASFYVVAVPTPIDEHKKPDLSPLLSATRTVGKVLAAAIMWCMNQLFIRDVLRRIAFRCWKRFRDSNLSPISRWVSLPSESIRGIKSIP